MAAARVRETAQPGADGSLVIANGRYRAVFSPARARLYAAGRGPAGTRLTWGYRARTVAPAR